MRTLKALFLDIDDTLYSTTAFAERARRNSVRALVATGLRVDPAALVISTGMIPSSMQTAMEKPEFIRRVFSGNLSLEKKDRSPELRASIPERRPWPQAVKSPQLSVDLL